MMNTNQFLEVLYREHEVIEEAARIAENADLLRQQNPEMFKEQTLLLLDFFREYADGYHHFKEEEVLFPALTEKSDLMAGGILKEMLSNHDDFRFLTANIRQNIENGNLEKAQSLIKQYVTELNYHIGAENDELFITAETLLSPDEQQKMAYRFEDIDRELGYQRKKEWENKIVALVNYRVS